MSLTRFARRLFRAVIVCVFSIGLLSGCEDSVSTKLTGTVGASLVSEATVEVLDPSSKTVIATAATDTSGQFSVNLSAEGPFLVRVVGGFERVFAENGTEQDPRSFQDGEFFVFLTGSTDEQTFSVSPATTLAYWISVGRAARNNTELDLETMQFGLDVVSKLAGAPLHEAPLLAKKGMDQAKCNAFLCNKMYIALLEEAAPSGVLANQKAFSEYLATLGVQYGLAGKVLTASTNAEMSAELAKLPPAARQKVDAELKEHGLTFDTNSAVNLNKRFFAVMNKYASLSESKKLADKVLAVVAAEASKYLGVDKDTVFSGLDTSQVAGQVSESASVGGKLVPLALQGSVSSSVWEVGETDTATLSYSMLYSDKTTRAPAKNSLQLSSSWDALRITRTSAESDELFTLTYGDGSEDPNIPHSPYPVAITANFSEGSVHLSKKLHITFTEESVPTPELSLVINGNIDSSALQSGVAEISASLALNNFGLQGSSQWPVTFRVDQGQISLSGKDNFSSSQVISFGEGESNVVLDYRPADNWSVGSVITLHASVNGTAHTTSQGVEIK